MKRILKGILSLLGLVAALSLTAVALLPLLTELLLPRLLTDLPFASSQIQLMSLSPWRLRGSIYVGAEDGRGLNIASIQVHYSPLRLLSGKIDQLELDGVSLQLKNQDGRLVVHGSRTATDTPQEHGSTALWLPMLSRLTLSNATLVIPWQGDEKVLRLDASFSAHYQESKPQPLPLQQLQGEIEVTGDIDLQLTGELHRLPADGYQLSITGGLADLGDIARLLPEPADIRLAGRLNAQGEILLDSTFHPVSGKVTGTMTDWRLRSQGIALQDQGVAQPVVLDLDLQRGKIDFSLNRLVFTSPYPASLSATGSLSLADRALATSFEFNPEAANNSGTLQLQTAFAESGFTTKYQLTTRTLERDSLVSSPLTAHGELHYEGGRITGAVAGNLPEIRDTARDLALTDVQFRVPLAWPPPEQTMKGSLNVARIKHRQVALGALTADLAMKAGQVSSELHLTTDLVRGLTVTCQAVASAEDKRVSCQFPMTSITDQEVRRLTSLPPDLTFQGGLAGKAQFDFSSGTPKGNAQLNLQRGELQQGETSVTGIDLELSLPYLPQLRTGPQQATVAAITLGKLQLTDTRLRFQLEDQDTIFIENLRSHWAKGKVETSSVRLKAPFNEVEATLYCDRLRLDDLLQQLGLKDTEGEGTLNGRLPIAITPKGLLFDDGFLFSTPGNSGIVRFNSSGQLQESLGSTVQAGYLDYSMQALENFAYNWTRLTFNSQEDQLLVSMQLDGKPAKPLPFGYQQGQIVPTTSGPGLQHPIRLDVNFRLPLQELLHYGSSLQAILENNQ